MPNRIKNERTVSILAYFIVGIIWYAFDKEIQKSELAKFHVKQSLNLTLVSIITSLLLYTLLLSVIAFPINLPPILAIILILVFIVISGVIAPIFFSVLSILGLINAINEKQKKIPIIGGLANRYLKF